MPSAEERERKLDEATRCYLRGEMTEEQFDAERRRYEVDYVAAFTALVRAQRGRRGDEGARAAG